ncbi:universal stress protein [Zavarzinia sp.]|uniref:universal stress protein n=1 Tax=Zavarzinia sp. TaxID=2027920 RepID=UPI003BB7CDBD|nr:universal stress protein [Zavarzinia sp.]
MSFRTILVPVERPKTARPALRHAIEFAREADAHVELFHPQIDPALLMPPVFDGLSGIAFAPELIASAQQAADELKGEIKSMMGEVLAELGCADIPRGRQRGFSLSFGTMVGAPERLVGRRARLADVAVIARTPASVSRGETDSLNGALWSSGRPVLFVPGIGKGDAAPGRKPSRILVAWNGSLEATRALTAAMPLLVDARQVDVVTFDKAVDQDGLDDVAAYLAAHGVSARTADIATEGYLLSKALFDRVLELDADLIVMGAYTHSRVREYLLGGLTQEILEGAPVPVLLAH